MTSITTLGVESFLICRIFHFSLGGCPQHGIENQIMPLNSLRANPPVDCMLGYYTDMMTVEYSRGFQ